MMKLSSRKKLLEESDEILSQIRIGIHTKKLNEGKITDLLSNLVSSIVTGIEKMIRSGKQTWLQNRMPYLVGLDLVNDTNIKIDRSILKGLDSIIRDIIKDIRNSSELKSIIPDLKEADREVSDWRTIYQRSMYVDYANMSKTRAKMYQDSYENMRKAEEHFQEVLLGKITKLIEKLILDNYRYKDFDKMIMDKLQRGVSGVRREDLEKIKSGYFKILAQRVAKEVERYEYDRVLTPREEYKRKMDKMNRGAY